MRKRILVIDDDLIYKKIIHKLFCANYELLMVENAKQAFDLINSSSSPDIIITDLNIPGKNGTEFITELSEATKPKHIPIIIVSGMDDDILRNELNEVGVYNYFLKPIDREKLKNEIQKLS